MVGTLVLGTSTEMCVGSSPTFGTHKKKTLKWWNGRHDRFKIF